MRSTTARDGSQLQVHIVNYYSARHVARCLASIASEPVDRVLILDNSCDDREWRLLQHLCQNYANVELSRAPRNMGFGGGHNQLASNASSNMILWLLNPDTIVAAGTTRALLSALETAEGEAIVSPVLLSGKGCEREIWYNGGAIDTALGVVKHLDYGKTWSGASVALRPFETEFVTGAAMMLRAGTFARLGGFDAKLFLYWEDVDMCLKARRQGVRLLVVPDACVEHLEGQSSGGPKSETYFYWSSRNRVVVCVHHQGRHWLASPRAAAQTLRSILAPLKDPGQTRPWANSVTSARGAVGGYLRCLRTER